MMFINKWCWWMKHSLVSGLKCQTQIYSIILLETLTSSIFVLLRFTAANETLISICPRLHAVVPDSQKPAPGSWSRAHYENSLCIDGVTEIQPCVCSWLTGLDGLDAAHHPGVAAERRPGVGGPHPPAGLRRACDPTAFRLLRLVLEAPQAGRPGPGSSKLGLV